MNEAGTSFSVTISIADEENIGAEALANRNAIIAAYHAMQSGHGDSLFEILDPDCEFHEAPSLPYGASKYGSAAVIAGVEGMFAAWSTLDIEIFEILAAGDRVIAYLNMRSTARATGKVYEGPTAELFRFRAGRIIEWRPIYWDTHEVFEITKAG